MKPRLREVQGLKNEVALGRMRMRMSLFWSHPHLQLQSGTFVPKTLYPKPRCASPPLCVLAEGIT